MSDAPQGPGWWQASDGKWYSPEQAPGPEPTPPPEQGAGTPPFGQPDPGAPGGYGPPGAYGAPGYGAPAYEAAAPGPLAEWGQRVVAYLIDWAMLLVAFIAVFILAAIFGAVSDALGTLVWIVGNLAVVVGSFYFYYLNGATGQSPGKALTGLKVIGERTGQPIGGGLGIVRGLAHFVDSIICYIGWLFPLWDERKQTLADKIMSTVVVTGAPKRDFGPEIFKA